MGGTTQRNRRRYTLEGIIRKLRETDRLLAEAWEVPEGAKHPEVSEATYHGWRAQYGGPKADDVRSLKELERERPVEADRGQRGARAS